jgi:hypothetical protein
VAMRQPQITADQVTQKKDSEYKTPLNEGGRQSDADAELGPEANRDVAANADETVPATLSRESNGIGTRNFEMTDRRLASAWRSLKCAQARQDDEAPPSSFKAVWM